MGLESRTPVLPAALREGPITCRSAGCVHLRDSDLRRRATRCPIRQGGGGRTGGAFRERPVLVEMLGVTTAAGPAVWFLAGNMLDPAVMFADVQVPEGYARVLCNWLAGPGPANQVTAAARIASQISRAQPSPLILVGHSSGGVLAMLIAMRVPDQVAGLLLVNAGADMDGHRSNDMPARMRAEFGAPGWWLSSSTAATPTP